MRQRLDGQHRTRPRRLQHRHQQQPDRPAPHHGRGAAERQVPEVHAVERYPERLEQGTVRVGHRVRQRVQQVCRPGHELTHHAVGLAVPGEPDPVAQVRVAVPARPAGPAGDGRIDGDPLAAPRPLGDHSRPLVPEHQRVREGGVADRALVPPVQVRAADPDRGDPHQAHPLARPGHWLIAHPQVAGRVESRRSHRISSPSAPVLFLIYTERSVVRARKTSDPRRRETGITGPGSAGWAEPRRSGRSSGSRWRSATDLTGPPR